MSFEVPSTPVLAVDDGLTPRDERLRLQLHSQRQLLDSSPDGIVVCDMAGTILLANRRLEELLGYPAGALAGQPLEVLIPEGRRAEHERHRNGYRQKPRVRAMAPTLELTARHADGHELPVEISLAPLYYEGQPVTIATVRDDRERQHHMRQLRLAEQRLMLAEERERIARDLHDIVIQRLFATGLSIQAVAMRASDALRPRLDDAVDAIDEAIHDIRSSIFQLSQGGPLRDSVRAGLFDLAAEAERLLGFMPRVHVDGPIDARLDGELGTEVLGVVREMVSNAVRHAQATELLITVGVDGDRVRASVVDDGVGPPDLDGPRAGRGLANLAERAQRRDGTFSLQARPEGGTAAVWTASLS